MRFRDFIAPPTSEPATFCSDGWEPDAVRFDLGPVFLRRGAHGVDQPLVSVADDFVGPTLSMVLVGEDGTEQRSRVTPVGHLDPAFARL